MIAAIAATILPLGFLIVLFGGGALFLRNNIEQDGEAPINRTLFYISKYSILALWGAMVLQIWGISISFFEVPPFLQVIGLGIMVFRICTVIHRKIRNGEFIPPGYPKGTHEPQGRRIIQIEQKSDVRRYVCNDGCIRPLYPESSCYITCSIRDCYPSFHCPRRGETYAEGIWPGIFGLPEPGEAIYLAAHCLPDNHILYNLVFA